MNQPEASQKEIESVIRPAGAEQSVHVGGKVVPIVPLKRGWQELFYQSALPMFQADIRPAEVVLKSLKEGTFWYQDTAKEYISAELEADAHLDRAAAVILASQVPNAERAPDATIQEQIEFVRWNSTTDELRKLVEFQAGKERMVERVGERSPVRFAALLNLAGIKDATPDSLKRDLMNFLQKSLESVGDGESMLPKPSGSSSDGSSATPSNPTGKRKRANREASGTSSES